MFILQFLTGMPGVCYALATYLAPYLGIGAANRQAWNAIVNERDRQASVPWPSWQASGPWPD